MLVSGGKEPFWEGGDVRAIKNTLKKPVEFPVMFFQNVSYAAQNFITGIESSEAESTRPKVYYMRCFQMLCIGVYRVSPKKCPFMC